MSFFPLFKLPRELREHIYSYALVSSSAIHLLNKSELTFFCCCDMHFSPLHGPIFYGTQEQDHPFTKHTPDEVWICDTRAVRSSRRHNVGISLPMTSSVDRKDGHIWRPNVALLRVCQQMKLEALPTLYSNNRFFFDERENIVAGRDHVSAPEMCFDFLMSLPESTLTFIRKLKFGTDIVFWKHARVFDFIKRRTRVDDLELCFYPLQHFHPPLNLRVSTLPWGNTEPIPTMNLYYLSKLNGLKRLEISIISQHPLLDAQSVQQRKETIASNKNMIRLLRKKMLSRSALRSLESSLDSGILSTATSCFWKHVQYTIDHVHSNNPTTKHNSGRYPSSHTAGHILAPGSDNEILSYEFRSRCVVCGEYESFSFGAPPDQLFEDGSIAEIRTPRAFEVSSAHLNQDAPVESWPDDLSPQAFYKLVTGLDMVEGDVGKEQEQEEWPGWPGFL